MTKNEFKQLFLDAVDEAVQRIEQNHSISLPNQLEIEFSGMGYKPDLIDVDTAVDRMYLGDDLFVFMVDVSVIKATDRTTTLFVRVSGHSPRSSIEATWNTPPGSGPFKQLYSMQFKYKQNNAVE